MKETLVKIEVTEEFELRIDKHSKRLLPRGWVGSVPSAVAREKEKDGKCRILDSDDPGSEGDDDDASGAGSADANGAETGAGKKAKSPAAKAE